MQNDDSTQNEPTVPVDTHPHQFSVIKNAHRLITYLTKNRMRLNPILIATHDYPDPDSLASAFALQHILDKAFSVSSKIVYGGIIGRMENRNMVAILKIPVHKLKETDFKKYENTALMDTQPHFRNNSFPKQRRATIVVDQHPSQTPPAADFSIVDPDCGATCVILAQALISLKLDIPANLATALIYGILTDTLNLYRADKPIVAQTYLKILPYCNMKDLARIQNPVHTKKFFVTIDKGVSHAVICKKLIVSHLGIVENPDLVAQTSDFLLSYKPVKWSMCTGRFKGRLYTSFRTTNKDAEAGEILRDVFDNSTEAGGHGTIAGGSFEVGLDIPEEIWAQKEMELMVRMQKRLRIAAKNEFVKAFN